MRHWFCTLCTLQFDKKVVFDLHQKLVHRIDSLRLIGVKEKEAKLCTENSITTNKSTLLERKNKNNLPDIWVPSHEKYASATCATATKDITEVPESNTVGSSTIVSESCHTTSTNLDITNFVSSITFEDEKNLDIKVEHKYDPEIISVNHEDLDDTHTMETFCQRPNVMTNLSRIEVIEKLASFTKESEVIDLSRSLTDLQNILRENLQLNLNLKLICKGPANSSQSSEIDTSNEKLTKEIEVMHKVVDVGGKRKCGRPKNDHLSNAYKEYSSQSPLYYFDSSSHCKKLKLLAYEDAHGVSDPEAHEKRRRGNLQLNLKSKCKEPANSSQSSEIDTSIEKLTKEIEVIHKVVDVGGKRKRGRPRKYPWSNAQKEYLSAHSKKLKLLADEDDGITCHMCLQGFWYKTYLFNYLNTYHGISDPEAYEKKRRGGESFSKNVKQSLDWKVNVTTCCSCLQTFNSKLEIINHFQNCYPAQSRKDSKQLEGLYLFS